MNVGLPCEVTWNGKIVANAPSLVEGLIALFSSVPSVHGVVDATSTTAA